MLKNYLKIAWRNLLKDRQFTFLNLVGLSTGLACVLLINLWVTDELSVDKFHDHSNRLYQVMERMQLNDGISVEHRTSGLTAEAMKNEMAEVEYAAAVMHHSWFPKFQVFANPRNKIKAIGQFASADFFTVFSYPLLEGNKQNCLADKKSIVISAALAEKLFSTSQGVVGKTLEWEFAGTKSQVSVTGVFSIPANSSDQFDFVLHFDTYKEIAPSVLHWGNNGTNTYLVLNQGTDVNKFNKKIEGFIKSKMSGAERTLFLTKYADRYLYGKYDNGVQSGGRIEYVRLFTVVAIFILIIACINFMNLSTAKASRRLKEVGIKKVVGAGRGSLILQYMGESVMMAAASVMFAISLVSIFLPQFNAITSKNIILTWDAPLILTIIAITLVTGLLSGSYPALYLSGFNPLTVLKGKLKSSLGELWVRKGLVVFQFTLSVVFIVSVVVVYKQMQLIQTKNLGYNKENIIYFSREGAIQEKPELFLSQLRKIPGVISATASDHRFAGGFNSTGDVVWTGKSPSQNIPFEVVHSTYGLIETLGIEMKDGRSFSPAYGTDSTKIIFNEAAIKVMGLQDPVGKSIRLWGREWEILGVTKNFHFASLHENIRPLFMLLDPQRSHYIMARIGAGKEQEALSRIKQLYTGFNPGSSFDYKFMDQDYQNLYVSEQRAAVLSRWFAGFAIIISCLGLFGLVAFTAQRRQKEIGIRKVIGASTGNVVMMLSKDFLVLVVIAVMIAFPIAWWAINSWLNNFAYRVIVGAETFVIAGVSIMLITLLTISLQSIKAAVANPVDSLRNE